MNWIDFFLLLCWLFSKTVSCSHAGYPLLPRASYPNVHLRLWCQERFHWLSPWCLTFETQMLLGTILFIRPKISIVFYFFWRSLTTSNWLAGCSLRWWKKDIIFAPKQFQTSSEGKAPPTPTYLTPHLTLVTPSRQAACSCWGGGIRPLLFVHLIFQSKSQDFFGKKIKKQAGFLTLGLV